MTTSKSRITDARGEESRPTGSRRTAEGSLRWPIRETFVEYVERMRDGLVLVEDGAQRLAEGFSFPLVERIRTQEGEVLRFRGTAAFRGHGGLLAVEFGALEIVRGREGARLDIAEPGFPGERLAILDLGEPRATRGGTVFEAPTLTEEGADLFFGNYRPGTRFDAVRLPGISFEEEA